MRRKPTIGLNCSYKYNEKYAANESFIFEQYYDSVAAAGGVPILLPPLGDQARIEELLGLTDGVVIVGGNDLDPSRYGQARHEKTDPVPPRRETFDLKLTGAALRMGVPLLAVCQGCQVLNVVLGGSLHQHLPEVYGEDVLHAPTDEMRKAGEERMHRVTIEKGTLLHRIVGGDTLDVNSSHHQSVDRAAEGLFVSARSSDGVIEALEWADYARRPFMLAVQWHPERIRTLRGHMLLFEALVRAAQTGRTRGGEDSEPQPKRGRHA